MRKTIKHVNILPRIEIKGECNFYEFTCRGCSIRNREEVWQGYVASISDTLNKKNDNSFLTLEEEPSNEHDPNAIMVVCRGEYFGTCGYVGKEYTGEIKKILSECKQYRVDIKNENNVGDREICLLIQWIKD